MTLEQVKENLRDHSMHADDKLANALHGAIEALEKIARSERLMPNGLPVPSIESGVARTALTRIVEGLK